MRKLGESHNGRFRANHSCLLLSLLRIWGGRLGRQHETGIPHEHQSDTTPCSGKVTPVFLLRAFEKGADGVYVAGCLEGDCHFIHGNLVAKPRVNYTKRLIEEVGLEPERLEMFNMSAAMGQRFAEVAREFTERIRQLGPSPLNKKYAKNKDEAA